MNITTNAVLNLAKMPADTRKSFIDHNAHEICAATLIKKCNEIKALEPEQSQLMDNLLEELILLEAAQRLGSDVVVMG